jgi:hypothetical protein
MKYTLTILFGLVALSVSAQYAIDWHKSAGGGSTSSGGAYQVSGTIGQHDAGGPLTGGNYSPTGGFWAIFAVQTPGSPLLRLFLTPTNTVVLAWPAPSTGFRLQHTPDLGTPNWSDVTNVVNPVNSENQVTISPPRGNRLYRLIYP